MTIDKQVQKVAELLIMYAKQYKEVYTVTGSNFERVDVTAENLTDAIRVATATIRFKKCDNEFKPHFQSVCFLCTIDN